MTIASVRFLRLQSGLFYKLPFPLLRLTENLKRLLNSAVAVGSSRNSITKLMDLKSETATLIENGVQRVISPDELRVGDAHISVGTTPATSNAAITTAGV